MEINIFKENFQRIAKERNLKNYDIAERAELSKQQLSDMLNGRKIIKLEDAIRIAEALGVTVNDLCGMVSNIEVPTGILFVTYEKSGKKILTLLKNNGEKILWEKRFLVEHLLDENLEVTEQMLKQEKELFVKSSSTM